MKPTADTEIEVTFARLRSAPDLTAATAATRAAALAAATNAIDARAEREAQRLRDMVTEVENARLRHREAAAASVEVARTARADALLREIFSDSDGALPALTRDHCDEPTRAVAGKFRTTLDAFNTRAIAEVGAEIDVQVVGALMCDAIVERPGFATAVGAFAQQFFGGTGTTFQLASDVLRATSAAATVIALSNLEAALVEVAQRWLRNYPGLQPSSDQRELFALRKRFVTLRDHTLARTALEQSQGVARFAETARTYRAPDTLSVILARHAMRDSGHAVD
jgi:hypothetical protein